MEKIEASDFKRLIGVWKTTGNITSGQNILKLIGIDSYEFVLEGNYILHRANVIMGNESSETLEIIKLDNARHKAKMHYFNTKGEEGTMNGVITNNDFMIEGNGLAFKGTINDENTEIKGKWRVQAENDQWSEFIDLTLEKKERE